MNEQFDDTPERDEAGEDSGTTGKREADHPPPRAFTQGTGLVFQAVGVMFVVATCCVCSSAFLWDPLMLRPTDPVIGGDHVGNAFRETLADPTRASLFFTIATLCIGGMALAAFGLGLQSDKRRAVWGALSSIVVMLIVLSVCGYGFWYSGAVVLLVLQGLILGVLLVLLGFAIAAAREVVAHPPPADAGVLPPGYKIPYSMYHDDPPQVRLARDIAIRKARLQAEQEELERLERDLEQRPRNEG